MDIYDAGGYGDEMLSPGGQTPGRGDAMGGLEHMSPASQHNAHTPRMGSFSSSMSPMASASSRDLTTTSSTSSSTGRRRRRGRRDRDAPTVEGWPCTYNDLQAGTHAKRLVRATPRHATHHRALRLGASVEKSSVFVLVFVGRAGNRSGSGPALLLEAHARARRNPRPHTARHAPAQLTVFRLAFARCPVLPLSSVLCA